MAKEQLKLGFPPLVQTGSIFNQHIHAEIEVGRDNTGGLQGRSSQAALLEMFKGIAPSRDSVDRRIAPRRFPNLEFRAKEFVILGEHFGEVWGQLEGPMDLLGI